MSDTDDTQEVHIDVSDGPIPVRDVATDTTVKAALIFLSFVVGTWALYVTRDLLAPFALAVFFWLIIDAFARWIDEAVGRVGYRLALAIAVLVIVGAIIGIIVVIADTAASIAADSDVYSRRLAELAMWVSERTGLDLSRNAVRDAFDVGALVSGGIGGFAAALQSFISNLFIIAVYVIFLFVAQNNFPKKLDDMMPDKEPRNRVRSSAVRIRHSIEKYLSVQTIISLLQTVPSFFLLLFFFNANAPAGIEGTAMGFAFQNALFWSLVIFILNYIPIIGAIGAALLPALFALVQFESTGAALLLGVLLLVVQSAIANTLQPKMMGDSMNLSPLVVVVALVAWGALWGGVGAFLSAPLTVIIMVILAQFTATRWLAVALSADGQPDIDPYEKKRNKAMPSM